MARLPIFKAGDRLSALSATEMNALVRAVRPLLNLTVRRKDGLLIKKSESGIEIGLNLATIIDPPKTPQAIRSVAIVETINDEHTSMQVREVGYADSPPESALEFKGESFEAYSYFGDATLADYKDFEFTGAIPNETTQVFNARKVDGDWILDAPSSGGVGTKIVRIKQIRGDYLVCREWNGVTETLGDIFVAKPWLLRRTPFVGRNYGGYTYLYTGDQLRTSHQFGLPSEDQKIVPPYLVSDELDILKKPTTAKRIASDADEDGGDSILWLEMSPTRVWAQVVAITE